MKAEEVSSQCGERKSRCYAHFPSDITNKRTHSWSGRGEEETDAARKQERAGDNASAEECEAERARGHYACSQGWPGKGREGPSGQEQMCAPLAPSAIRLSQQKVLARPAESAGYGVLAVVYNKGATQKGSAPTKEGGQGYVYKLGLKNGKTPVEEKDPVRPSLLQ